MATTERYDPIPETVDDALKRWDAGESVFTVEMGGIGPGYEQCIQILAFELMREFKDLDWEAVDAQERGQAIINAVVGRLNGDLHFSGAQVGAAGNLASRVCKVGYRKALREDAVKDRLIQVSRKMPEAPSP